MTSAPNNNQKPFTIAICGGGITGLSLAIGLLRHNVPFHLYESAHAFAEVGAGVAFGPNALQAMTLIDPRIREGYEKIATHNGFESKRGAWFDFVVGMDCGLGKAGKHIVEVRDREGVGQSSVHRAAFLDQLVAMVPRERVTFAKRVVAVEEGKDGVRLKFEDGGEAQASAVVGCDGVKSNLRKIVLGEKDEAAYPRFTGKYVYRDLIPMQKAAELLGEELARNSVMWLGVHGHLTTYPIDKGQRINVAAIHTKPDGKWDDESWVLPSDKETMKNDFAGFGENAKNILSLMEKPYVWAFFEHPPARTYYEGRICLTGDAAHATTPFQGAGAGMALEDAFILSSLLGDVGKEGDLEQAFEAFDRVRRPRTQKMVSTSRECGHMLDCEGLQIGEDADAMRENLTRRYIWIWEKKLDDDLEEGLEILRTTAQVDKGTGPRL